MTSVVALGAVSGGMDVDVSEAELLELGLMRGSYLEISGERMEAVRQALERRRGSLPEPNSGGSMANTAVLITHACLNCGSMGLGGDDDFCHTVVIHTSPLHIGLS